MKISARYKRVSGPNPGREYAVVAPYSEEGATLRWTLHAVNDENERVVVAEGDLTDAKQWQALK
jgi:hypothetical protein